MEVIDGGAMTCSWPRSQNAVSQPTTEKIGTVANADDDTDLSST